MSKDSKNNQDNRSVLTHLGHAFGHQLNSVIKEAGYKGIESTGLYRSISPGKSKSWEKEVDNQRSAYHYQQANQKWNKAQEEINKLEDMPGVDWDY